MSARWVYEIDFVAGKGDDRIYYPKYIVTMDEVPMGEDGIRQVKWWIFCWGLKVLACKIVGEAGAADTEEINSEDGEAAEELTVFEENMDKIL